MNPHPERLIYPSSELFANTEVCFLRVFIMLIFGSQLLTLVVEMIMWFLK